ncbi:TerB N-terminal domain-containing protein [Clostridium sp. 'White wine YQ']|uniref:TerB N-terminal domain-containing protein n=1 Tax=Clostridium sp. 'White wine YQ' TaxID=3027474 RepID=UPI00236678A8|nr:TerB N-terminal domain-containing protein [Clostridium sp. 'White wine YQ']MDD7794123.1 TerB N-terminal domain-containing protein [Clostridium sp. 'White wine YQ']
MGLLNFLFRKKESNNTSLILQNRDVVAKTTDDLFIHPDIENLIWIADGIRKNYISNKKQEIYEFNGIKITFLGFNQDEPSLIHTKLPLAELQNIYNVERPPYYPTYSQLTPEQKTVYWKLLSNPYDSNIDIGFVFILYYGLERHLLNGDYEKAFRVILKLRDVHENKSFQQYSGSALILTCLLRQRADLALEFMQSIDKEHELKISDNLFVFCKYSLDIPLTADDIMMLAKSFEFNNNNYIKGYTEIFKATLLDNLKIKYNSDTLLISKFINETEFKKLRKQNLTIFANVSISNRTIEVPIVIENFKFKKALYDLLESTHNQVKAKISELRKNGELEHKETKNNKAIEVLTFDEVREKDILSELNEVRNNFVKRHFVLIDLQDFYYKYRDVDTKYLKKCIECCFQDINSLELLQKKYYQEELNRVKSLSSIYSKKEMDKRISEIGKFNGSIPAFKRLAIIFEKQKDYEKAIEICDIAINYYKNLDMTTSVAEFQKRKDKLVTKENRRQGF